MPAGDATRSSLSLIALPFNAEYLFRSALIWNKRAISIKEREDKHLPTR